MKVKGFSDLAAPMRADEARRRRVAAHKEDRLAELALADLRSARQTTQTELARSLQTTQFGISRLEHQVDLYLSTLRNNVEALGGGLELYGVFPDARLPITMFGALDEYEAERKAERELASARGETGTE